MGEVITVDRIMAGWETLDYRKKKQADHWLPWISSLFCHCKCLPPSSLSPFPFFSGPLAFIPPSFLREPSPEHSVLSSSLWDTCTHHPIAIMCCLCSDCLLSLSVHGHEGLSSYSDPEQYPHRLPNLLYPLPDTEQKWQSKNSSWM